MKKVVYLILVACIILGTQAIYVNSVHAKVTYSEKRINKKRDMEKVSNLIAKR